VSRRSINNKLTSDPRKSYIYGLLSPLDFLHDEVLVLTHFELKILASASRWDD
jgi:hypothetical protein